MTGDELTAWLDGYGRTASRHSVVRQRSIAVRHGVGPAAMLAAVLRKDGKIELMRTVPLFAQCTKRELGTIASLADLVDVPEGTRLVTQGGRGRDFMIIVEGEAEVRRNDRRINTLSDGDFFGEVAVIIEGPRIASVTTTAPTRLLVLRDTVFWSMLEESPVIQMRILKALAERVRPLVI